MIEHFANKRVMQSFFSVAIHPMLFEIVYFVYQKYGKLVITSAWRSRKIHPHDSGIHTIKEPYLRALDLRSSVYDDPVYVEYEINQRFQYDPKRPKMKCALFHESFDFKGKSLKKHFHLQVHDRTRQI